MTLTKAIEAAKEYFEDGGEGRYGIYLTKEEVDQLAALPEKPMTEKEMLAEICKASNLQSPVLKYETDYWLFAIKALKAQNCLYVEE